VSPGWRASSWYPHRATSGRARVRLRRELTKAHKAAIVAPNLPGRYVSVRRSYCAHVSVFMFVWRCAAGFGEHPRHGLTGRTRMRARQQHRERASRQKTEESVLTLAYTSSPPCTAISGLLVSDLKPEGFGGRKGDKYQRMLRGRRGSFKLEFRPPPPKKKPGTGIWGIGQRARATESRAGKAARVLALSR
jgi:hypothetical protein